MNAVEIEEAVSALFAEPFSAPDFPFSFLEAYGNRATTIRRLKADGGTNRSDVGGVLQTGNIHILTAEPGQAEEALQALRGSKANTRFRVKFLLATDGDVIRAEALGSGETLSCDYVDFPDKFAFFLALAGISTVREIRENAFDIKATARLNRLYVELLKHNPGWAGDERRHEMNRFMARLIFCFFAEDTGIFNDSSFTAMIEQMSARDSSNTHRVIATLFQAMDTPREEHEEAEIPRWARDFP